MQASQRGKLSFAPTGLVICQSYPRLTPRALTSCRFAAAAAISSGQHYLDRGLHMDLHCIEEWDALIRDITQNQGQFGPSEDQAIDSFVLFHAIDDGQQSNASFVEKNAFDQFVHVTTMNVGLLLRSWHHNLHAFTRKNLGIEASLHGETGTNQPEPFQAERFRSITTCADDAD